MKNNELTLRSLVIGMLGCIVITTSSMYVALRLGALPWPTIFVAILSMTILKILGKTNLKEINVTHTAMSAGAMIAGGLAFTIPAIWILDKNAEFAFWPILIITIAATILGLGATSVYRRFFIEANPKDYAYPMGIAAFQTVKAGDAGGKQAIWLFSAMGLSAIFTLLRDQFGKIPPLVQSSSLAAKNISLGFWMSPMAVGIGYIIGPIHTGIWALGAILGYGLLVPLGIQMEWFSDATSANDFRSSLGLGLMVGTGIGILIGGILTKNKDLLKNIIGKDLSGKNLRWMIPVIFMMIVITIFMGTDFLSLGMVGLIAILLAIAGALVTSVIAAILTGQTGINPMEILGILVLLMVKIFAPQMTTVLVLTAALTAVTAGLAGDMMNDYKAGYLFGTQYKNQRVAETLGALTGSLVSVIFLYMLVKSEGTAAFGNPEIFPAPQAHAVAAMAGGIPQIKAFWIGIIVGTLLVASKLPVVTLGLGMYLPTFISTPIFLGGLAAFIRKQIKNKNQDTSIGDIPSVVASGFLGGEGVTGVILAIISFASAG